MDVSILKNNYQHQRKKTILKTKKRFIKYRSKMMEKRGFWFG